MRLSRNEKFPFSAPSTTDTVLKFRMQHKGKVVMILRNFGKQEPVPQPTTGGPDISYEVFTSPDDSTWTSQGSGTMVPLEEETQDFTGDTYIRIDASGSGLGEVQISQPSVLDIIQLEA